jgi:hypothetical protein
MLEVHWRFDQCCEIACLAVYPHPRCFAKRVWIVLISQRLAFLEVLKRLQMTDSTAFTCKARMLFLFIGVRLTKTRRLFANLPED